MNAGDGGGEGWLPPRTNNEAMLGGKKHTIFHLVTTNSFPPANFSRKISFKT
jgi:hypothetical protein